MILWEEMKLRLLRQFRSTQTGTLHEQWIALKQDGSVREFRRKFIELAAPLDDIPEEMALGTFVNGLNQRFEQSCAFWNPATWAGP